MKKILATLFFLLPVVAQAQIVGTLPFQLQNGTTADATQVMADFNKILTDVNANAAKKGINTDITALIALTTPITPVQGGTTIYYAATSGGTANAQTVATPAPTGFTLATGKRTTFVAGFTNTGPMTLDVNSTGATAVMRMTPAGPVALIGGEVVANNYVEVVFDGTQFQLYTDATQKGGFGSLTTLGAGGTVDLGTVSSHNVLISGTTTITSFGSSALTTYPIYRIKFDNALTLTHNATSLILQGNTNITTAANDTAMAQYLGSGNWQVSNYSKANGAAVASAVPTRQVVTTAQAGTYTTPANVRWIRIRLVGGGGGGGGGNNGAVSTAGNNSTFNAGALVAGGGGFAGTATQGAAGSASGGNIMNIAGGSGNGSNGSTNGSGAGGGNSCLGGAGGGGLAATGAGLSAAANSGSGGGGGAFSVNSAGGGGAGGCVEHVITSPAASYTYAVGAGGAGAAGSGGGGNGGNGATGIMIVEEYY
jgi:hypothetical protein